jgi:hypothetical protein
MPDELASGHQPFRQREMAFKSYTSFAVSASEVGCGTKSFAGLLKFPGVNDPYELEGWNSKLKLIRDHAYPRTPGCRVSDRRSPLHPISRHKHSLVPEGDDRPALPLLRDWLWSELSHPSWVMTAPAA